MVAVEVDRRLGFDVDRRLGFDVDRRLGFEREREKEKAGSMHACMHFTAFFSRVSHAAAAVGTERVGRERKGSEGGEE